MRAEERDFGWSKVKVSDLYLLWFDVTSMEGRKEEKVKEIKGQGHSAIWGRVKEWTYRVWGLVQSWRTAWMRADKKGKIRKSKKKWWEIYSEKECSKWNENDNFFGKCCNLYLIHWNYLEFVP